MVKRGHTHYICTVILSFLGMLRSPVGHVGFIFYKLYCWMGHPYFYVIFEPKTTTSVSFERSQMQLVEHKLKEFLWFSLNK